MKSEEPNFNVSPEHRVLADLLNVLPAAGQVAMSKIRVFSLETQKAIVEDLKNKSKEGMNELELEAELQKLLDFHGLLAMKPAKGIH